MGLKITALAGGLVLLFTTAAWADKKVWLEKPVIFSDESGQNQFVPYRQRRSPWGFHVGVGYSFYAPVNYVSDFQGDTSFDQPRWRLFEAIAAARWNSAMGSLSIEARGGLLRDSIELVGNNGYAPAQVFQDNGNPPPTPDPTPPPTPTPTPTPSPPASDNVISLQMITSSLGIKWSLDSITREPWLVPFLSAGAFMIFYTEEKDESSLQGRSDVGFYYSGGLLLQLDWLDRDASVDFYLDSGIENTFIMCEVRQFIEVGQGNDLAAKSFTGPVHFNVGLLIEF